MNDWQLSSAIWISETSQAENAPVLANNPEFTERACSLIAGRLVGLHIMSGRTEPTGQMIHTTFAAQFYSMDENALLGQRATRILGETFSIIRG